MVIDIFILLLIIAFILMIIAYNESSMLWTSLSLLLWIFLSALSLYIEIPYQTAVPDFYLGTTNLTANVTEYSQRFFEPVLSMVCIGFAFINIILLAIFAMDYKNRRRYRI